MAVQPRHLINNREFIGVNEGNRTVFNNVIGYGGGNPITGMMNWNSQPIYFSNINSGSMAAAPSAPAPSLSFLGEDISLEIQQQQLEIDQLITMHAEQLNVYIHERRNRDARRILQTVEQKIVMKLRERDEEIAKIGQINFELQEKVKNLCNENQLWKDLAHRNEMTANVLRSNLDQMLDQIQLRQEQFYGGDEGLELNEVSFCSSNSINGGGGVIGGMCDEPARGGGGGDRRCRRCGTEEATVVLLPCRHLCVCSDCGNSVESCPICGCTKNGSVNINLSF